MATPISRDDLLRLRLAHHGLAAGAQSAVSALEVVSRLLAVQAQEFGQALWALGLRVPGSTRADILAVLDSAQVVRSSPIRGTLHFVRPDDLRWMLRLTAPRMIKSAARRLSELDLDQRTLDRAREVAGEALAGGMALGREEFLDVLNRAGLSIACQRGYHLIWYLAQSQTVCWGPTDGSRQALVLLDEWAPPGREPDREEALRRFVLGYFTGHGPATLQDFVWWSKLTVADARIGLAGARAELTEYVHEGLTYWASAAAAPGGNPEAGLLLPGFDEYILGYQDRSLTLPPEHAARIVLANNGVFRPALVVGGRAVGTWRRPPRGGTPTVDPFPGHAPADPQVFDDAIRGYERFLGP